MPPALLAQLLCRIVAAFAVFIRSPAASRRPCLHNCCAGSSRQSLFSYEAPRQAAGPACTTVVQDRRGSRRFHTKPRGKPPALLAQLLCRIVAAVAVFIRSPAASRRPWLHKCCAGSSRQSLFSYEGPCKLSVLVA